ncbi:MAG: hypothetical protein V7L21_27775 [Nostoc sp.]
MQKAQKPIPSAPLPLCPWSGLNDKSLTGHDMTLAPQNLML